MVNDRDDADVRDRDVIVDGLFGSKPINATNDAWKLHIAYVESIRAERDAAVRERDWLAKQVANAFVEADYPDGSPYPNVGDWLARAKEATHDAE